MSVEDKPARRSRAPKKAPVEEPQASEQEREPEAPQSRARRAEVRQKEEAKAGRVILGESFELKGDKVVKVMKKANGNSYRKFQFVKSKNPIQWDRLVEDQKKQGKQVAIA